MCVPEQQIAKCNNAKVYEDQLAKHAFLIEKLRLDFLEIEKETITEDINDINSKIEQIFTDGYIENLIETEFVNRFQISPKLMSNKMLLIPKYVEWTKKALASQKHFDCLMIEASIRADLAKIQSNNALAKLQSNNAMPLILLTSTTANPSSITNNVKINSSDKLEG
jgi:hypothetical protein